MPDLPGKVDFAALNGDEVSRVVVGLSGGVDSVVLLDLVMNHLAKPIVALHVNHHMHDQADATASFCLELCQALGVPFQALDVTVSTRGSLETNARQARYEAFADFLQPGDLLLLAHHADDQLETLLFRLFRGSRIFGLEGMPGARPLGLAELRRPLLDCSRAELLDYAQERGLKWQEDPTNADLTPDRNFIRHELLPRIASRFPAFRSSMLMAMERDERARPRLMQSCLEELEPCRPAPDALHLKFAEGKSRAELLDLLTAWLLDLKAPLPSGKFLGELCRKLKEGQVVDETPGQLSFHVFAGALHAGRALPKELPEPGPLVACVEVPGGRIVSNFVTGRGLKAEGLTVAYRKGGEKLAMRHRRSLKNVFQESGVPPWLRCRLPLIYSGSELVAVAGLPGWQVPMMIADGWQAQGSEEGCEVELQLNDRLMSP